MIFLLLFSHIVITCANIYIACAKSGYMRTFLESVPDSLLNVAVKSSFCSVYELLKNSTIPLKVTFDVAIIERI